MGIQIYDSDDLKGAYQQGRVDAISEYANKLLCLVSNKCKFIITKDCTYYAMEQEEIDKLIYETAEEMKEQKSN